MPLAKQSGSFQLAFGVAAQTDDPDENMLKVAGGVKKKAQKPKAQNAAGVSINASSSKRFVAPEHFSSTVATCRPVVHLSTVAMHLGTRAVTRH